jgi:trehalose 6-phosphate phosphatase
VSVATGLIEALSQAPESSGLFVDFDGTLSEIVHVPSEARPVAGAARLLERLGRRLGLVAVVSGRKASELQGWLGPGIEIWGVHGSERTVDGKVVLSDRAAPYEAVMKTVRAEIEEHLGEPGLEGAIVEDKGVMLGLHFRAAADVAQARAALERLSHEAADRHGLRRAEGRLAFELRPPVELTKKAVVLDRARELGLTAAAFIGDDTVDLPAFEALDQLAAEGVTTVRVAVDSHEAPEELLERADVTVRGPRGAVKLLSELDAALY